VDGLDVRLEKMKITALLLQLAIMVGSAGAGLIVGLGVSLLGYWIPGGHDLYGLIGTAVWISSAATFYAYATLHFVHLPKRLRNSGACHNLTAAQPFGLLVAFGLIGAGIAAAGGADTVSTIIVAVGWGTVGVLFGSDLRRRERELTRRRSSMAEQFVDDNPS
jgi:hypothetical protein